MADKEARRARLARWWERSKTWTMIGLLITLFVTVYFADRMFHSVHSGERGVLWRRFGGGTQLDKVYDEGMVVTAPWNRFYKYNVRLQEINGDLGVLSKDGALISMKYSARFHATRRFNHLPLLHAEIGPDYVEKVVRVEVVSALRRIIGNFTPEEIYAHDEAGLLAELLKDLSARTPDKYVTFDSVLIKELRLPPPIEAAINDKLAQLHHAESYVYRLQREESERQRKEIEARGIRQFESIAGIPILQWRGIEATVQLATSPNSKIVVIGSGRNGLPIILNPPQ